MLSATTLSTTPRARRRALGALGLELARRGVLAKVSLAVAALTVSGALVATATVARRSGAAALEQAPSLTAATLAWGAGVLFAFAVSVHVLKRDREGGVMALLRARGAPLGGYLVTRVGGLTAMLALVVAGGTLLVGVLAVALGTRGGAALRATQGTAAALAYALAFAAVLGPLAMAALGARSRAGGYVTLLFVLVLPELLAPVAAAVLPYGLGEMASIPGALTALRVALMPPGVDGWRAGKALFVLAIVVAASLAAVRRSAGAAARAESP